MIHGTVDKEIRFVLSTLESVQNCRDRNEHYNHDAMCYLVSLIEIAQNYAILLSETPPVLPVLGRIEV